MREVRFRVCIESSSRPIKYGSWPKIARCSKILYCKNFHWTQRTSRLLFLWNFLRGSSIIEQIKIKQLKLQLWTCAAPPLLFKHWLLYFNQVEKTMLFFKYLLTTFAVANAFMPSPSHRGVVTSRNSFGSAIQQRWVWMRKGWCVVLIWWDFQRWISLRRVGGFAERTRKCDCDFVPLCFYYYIISYDDI